MAHKRPILKLGASFFPLDVCAWEDVMVNIFSGAVFPIDIWYSTKEDGTVDVSTFETFVVVRHWKEWCKLEIREYDDYVNTTHGPVRLPSVVVTSRYNRVRFKKVQFPSAHNIHKRDNYTCAYTGKKLSKEELSIDHIVPISRGGQDTWENLVCCEKKINNFKDNRLPHECGLKLLWEPTKPVNGLESIVFNAVRDEWQPFIKAK